MTALVRARLCEPLADEDPRADPQRAYTTGQLSVIDGLLDTPLPDLLDELGLDAVMTRAIVYHGGPEARLLRTALAYERGDFTRRHRARRAPDRLTRNYRTALTWADHTAHALH